MQKKILYSFFFLLSYTINAQCWQSVSVGGAHTVAIANNGTLWAWGQNFSGQLGTGTTSNSSTPVQVSIDSNWSAVSCGNGHTIALKNDGTLWAWGRNADGQLGDGANTNLLVPTKIGSDTNWQFISAGDEYTTAIKTNGSLWAWGDNTYGQLGDNSILDRNTPIQIGTATNWLKISAGTFHTLAIRTNGTLWAWGRNQTGQLGDGTASSTIVVNSPLQIGTDTNWSAVSAAVTHSVACKTDNSLWTWGSNFYGQLGDGTNVDKYSPTNIAIAVNQVITKGQQHTIVRKADGTLWSWGGNTNGQLGDGTNVPKLIPVSVSSSAVNWLSINSKGSHSAGLQSDGTLWTWGLNSSGQLGLGFGPALNVPTKVTCPSLSVEENSYGNYLTLYPNPATSLVSIDVASDIIIDKIIIVDLYGKTVFENNENVRQVTIENLPSGLYFIKVMSAKRSFLNKFVKN